MMGLRTNTQIKRNCILGGMAVDKNFNELIRQHDELRSQLEDLKADLKNFSKPSYSYKPMFVKLKDFSLLFLEHVKQEEEKIFPALREMYQSEVEMISYIQSEHHLLVDQLASFIDWCEQCLLLEDRGEQPDKQIKQKLENFLLEVMKHLYQEEQALYPMINMYLGMGR